MEQVPLALKQLKPSRSAWDEELAGADEERGGGGGGGGMSEDRGRDEEGGGGGGVMSGDRRRRDEEGGGGGGGMSGDRGRKDEGGGGSGKMGKNTHSAVAADQPQVGSLSPVRIAWRDGEDNTREKEEETHLETGSHSPVAKSAPTSSPISHHEHKVRRIQSGGERSRFCTIL